MCNQFVRGRHIDTVDVRETNFRRRRGEVHFLRPGFTGHLNNLLRSGTTYDGVIHQQHVFIAELSAVRVQLTADGFTTQLLTRHDKGTANVAVFHKTLTVRLAKNAGDFQRDIAGGFRDGNNHVDIQIFPFTRNLLAKLGAHIDTRAVDGDFVDEGVWTRKIDVFEQARVADRIIRTLAGKQLTFFGDVDGFARRDIAQEFKAQRIERHAF